MKSLTLQFVSYDELSGLDSNARIKKLLKIVIENKIVLMQGKLSPKEEAKLIENTMILVGTLKKFKGIELAVINSNGGAIVGPVNLVKKKLASFLVGDRDALTVIGPATLVRSIKKNPKKIEFLLGKK